MEDISNLQVYLVGGAVRDELLGLPVSERDWVVVGSTAEDMLKLGFQQVGKDFPVFLHPDTREEYALARTERKVAEGHTGFVCHADPNVTLEEDLLRRDLTVNAMARDNDGQLIDPYRGQDDLNKSLLRHVSAAFEEDPLRILRVARFAAQIDFQVDHDTLALMASMVARGDLAELPPERIFAEVRRALTTASPVNFFQVLDKCGALPRVFPGLALADCEVVAAALEADAEERFALLMHHLTPEQVKDLCLNLKVPNSFHDLALMMASHFSTWQQLPKASDEEVIRFYLQLDGARRPERLIQFNSLCQALNVSQGTGNEAAMTLLVQAQHAYQGVDRKRLQQQYQGPAFGEALIAAAAALLAQAKAS